MPTYRCAARAGALDAATRVKIARAIGECHREATGAPTYLVQVAFEERPAGSCFLGDGVTDDHIFIEGDIRAGRTPEQRTRLAESIVSRVAAITGKDAADLWVYLRELQPTDMVEYGQVLPKAGAEEEWFETLPDVLKNRLLEATKKGGTCDS